MNYLRLTQRPVQTEVYDYCDRLGLMTQTDLPCSAVCADDQFCEAVRQAEEMERLVRSPSLQHHGDLHQRTVSQRQRSRTATWRAREMQQGFFEAAEAWCAWPIRIG